MADRQLTPEEIDANIAKARAEAKAFEAKATESLAAAHQYEESVKTEKLTQKQMAHLIEHSRIESAVASIALEKCLREERFARVNDVFFRQYSFDEQITERTVKACCATLQAWSRDEPGCSIRIVVNSPGGSVVDGLCLVDFVTDLRKQGHNITIVVLGMAASMGAVLLQSATTRVMGRNAVLLIHEGSLGAVGSFAAVEDQMSLMKMFHSRILRLFEERAKPINPKTTEAFIRKNWSRKDWWIDSETALTLGFCDEVQ